MTDPTPEPTGSAPGQPEPKKPHLLIRLWRLWDRLSGWWDRLVSWHDWGQWLLALLKTKAGIAAAGAVGTAAAVGTVALVQPELLPRWPAEPPAAVQEAPPPPPPPPATIAAPAPEAAPPAVEPTPPAAPVTVKAERWNANIVVFAVSGKDRTGRAADFEIAVLTREFTWLRGSDEQLARNDRALTAEDLATMVFDSSTRASLVDSLAVIAVGLASAEGSQASEAERARRRAATSARWLAETVASAEPAIPLWTLNLGQFLPACRVASGSADSSWQRPFMMLAVRRHDDGVELGEALKDAMTGKTNVPSPACYSAFELVRTR